MGNTSIEWCDHSINPIRARDVRRQTVGHYCEKIDPGCAHCYSSELQRRFGTRPFMGRNNGSIERGDVEVFLDEGKLLEVRKRRKPTRYFWCDMTDIFGEWVKPEWMSAIFATIDATPQHTHMLLTKRPENVRRMWVPPTSKIPGYEGKRENIYDQRNNVWLGTSISDQPTADQNVPELLKCRDLCPVLFLSAEPLLGPIDLTAAGAMMASTCSCLDPWATRVCTNPNCYRHSSMHGAINWIIVGGESGPHARPCNIEWVRSLRDQCGAAGVPCFIKQLGSVPFEDDSRLSGAPIDMTKLTRLPGAAMKDKKGGDWNEWPKDLRVREFPHMEAATNAP